MPLMCPENRRMLAWVEVHHAEVSAWLLLHEGKLLEYLDAWERCDAGYAMLKDGRP